MWKQYIHWWDEVIKFNLLDGSEESIVIFFSRGINKFIQKET